MGFWTALVVIVALVIFAKTRNDRLAEERREGSRDHTVQLEREVAELRKRLEVLERIITDERGSGDLARRINALRDE